MAARLAAILVTVALAIILGITAFVSGGVPSAPTASISGTPNPALAQTLQLTFVTKAYSAQVPNSIDLLGAHFIYTIWQTNGNGGTSVLAFNQQVATSAVNQSGNLFTLSATVQVTTTAICAGSATCGQTPYNITVSLKAQVSTYPALWSSPTSTIVFSNFAAFTSVPMLTAPSPTTWYLEFWVPITGAFAGGLLLIGAAFAKHPIVLSAGVVALILLAVELLLWG